MRRRHRPQPSPDDNALFTDDEEHDDAADDDRDDEKRSELEVRDHRHSRSSSLRPTASGAASAKKPRTRHKSMQHVTPRLSLSATSSVTTSSTNFPLHRDPEHQLNDELSSSLDFSGLESCGPSEMIRADSIMTECRICMERDKSTAFLPCGHYIACRECADLLRSDSGLCAICSVAIDGVLRIYE